MLDYRSPHSSRPISTPTLTHPSSQRDTPPPPSTRGPSCGCNEWITDWWMPPAHALAKKLGADLTFNASTKDAVAETQKAIGGKTSASSVETRAGNVIGERTQA